MFSVVSTISRPVQPCSWRRGVPVYLWLARAAFSSTRSLFPQFATDEQRQAYNARCRQTYVESAEVRKKSRERAKVQYYRERSEHSRTVRPQTQHEALATRRATLLQKLIRTERWIREDWTWKTHTPVMHAARVDYHCTACGRNRFLKLWWKEKLPTHHLDQERYMCNACFANKWDLVVPETCSGKLHRVFTSPDYPPPYASHRLKLAPTKAKHESKGDDRDKSD